MISTNRTCVSHALCYVDGPNIDQVLGRCVLGHRPSSEERPRWDRVHDECLAWFGAERPCFVLNGNRFTTSSVFGFRRALRSIGFDVQCPRSAADDPVDEADDPVDEFVLQEIQDSLHAVRSGRVPRVILFSHDHGYASALHDVLQGNGAVTIVGFREELAPALLALESEGADVLDLEYDLAAFDIDLGRPYRPGERAA
ncbi:MAG: NYN domain-containing protein [Planctomycetes bacterium]|nr:NYN domain-containing protein [Planctomycetota bacterium]